jgi:hypothetical protein
VVILNFIRNPLKIMSPWWYYIENAFVANGLVAIILGFGLIGILEDRSRTFHPIDLTEIFWPFFIAHVLAAVGLAVMAMFHDMTSHPDFFKEVTQWE